MAKNDKLKAARDLFSVSLDLDIIDFKLNNIIDDLADGFDPTLEGYKEEQNQIKDIKERARALRKLCESVRVGWEHAEGGRC